MLVVTNLKYINVCYTYVCYTHVCYNYAVTVVMMLCLLKHKAVCVKCQGFENGIARMRMPGSASWLADQLTR
jgi:hypothetical protein